MDNSPVNQLKQRNKELIDIVIQKVQKEYQDDIDLIGVFGSFFTGDFYLNVAILLPSSKVGEELPLSFIKRIL